MTCLHSDRKITSVPIIVLGDFPKENITTTMSTKAVGFETSGTDIITHLVLAIINNKT